MMLRSPLNLRAIRLVSGLLFLSGLTACNSGPGASVTVTGPHSAAIGETIALSAATENATDGAYTWSSGDTAIATVDASGTVTGVAEGETLITATGQDSDVSGTHAVVVTAMGTPVVQLAGDTFVVVGATITLSATTVNGVDSGYTWTSSDEAVATIAADGTVTGVFPGTALMTATGDDTGASASVSIRAFNEIPHYEEWLGSGHANSAAEPFNHWNEDDPAEIPATCARCHSTPGFMDYVGADGTAFGSVESAAPVGTVIECRACHNAATQTLSRVIFPSGVEVTDLGPEARCMTCHQGRASGDTVDEAITMAAPADDDTVSTDLSFINIHYYAAGATLNAGRVRGGYQYAGQVYDWRFRHVPGRDTCVGCHNPHTLEVRTDACATCHDGVATAEDARNIRMMSSRSTDYDGDGDLTEGIYFEMVGLRDLVLEAIQAYPGEFTRDAICYDAAAYPYFFIDTDGNGTCEATEAAYPNRYTSWTARLLRAAYNFQVASKDPGAFAHNAKYVMELLFDSLADLNTVLTTTVGGPVERNDPGHFNGSGEPARHWDDDEAVSSSCSRCHGGAEGFRFFADYGVGATVAEPDNGLDCATCHTGFGLTPADFTVVSIDPVTFPSGAEITDATDPNNNICVQCHQGRVSASDIDASIARAGAGPLGFSNVHYLAAGATYYGNLVNVAYEWPARTYAGQRSAHTGGDGCLTCHDPVATQHTFMPSDNMRCGSGGCHAAFPSVLDIRVIHTADYDGDGDTTEQLGDEIDGLSVLLLAAMRSAATTPICYTSTGYPYFFVDTNDNGTCEASEATYGNRYRAFTPDLLRAAHNYQLAHTEPGAWAHNFDYMGQILYDSIDVLGGSVAGLTRP